MCGIVLCSFILVSLAVVCVLIVGCCVFMSVFLVAFCCFCCRYSIFSVQIKIINTNINAVKLIHTHTLINATHATHATCRAPNGITKFRPSCIAGARRIWRNCGQVLTFVSYAVQVDYIK